MRNFLRRRSFMKVLGGGVAMATTGSTTHLASGAPKIAIDRSGVTWGNRPMYLRPYHPTYLVCYYARRFEKKDIASSVKWDPLVARVENEPDLKIHIVECFDDACAGCRKLCPDPLGCMWGVGYTCTSANKPETVANVVDGNKRILSELGLFFGTQIMMKHLVPVLEKKIPVLYDIAGGTNNQAHYEKGLNDLKLKYGL